MLGSLPGGSDGKESACNAGDLGWMPGLGGSPGEGNGNPLQYSCQDNPMGRGAWWATVHEEQELDTTERLTLQGESGLFGCILIRFFFFFEPRITSLRVLQPGLSTTLY